MIHDDKVGNGFEEENIKQIEKMTAYGINGFSVIENSEDSLENEDIKADKEQSRG